MARAWVALHSRMCGTGRVILIGTAVTGYTFSVPSDEDLSPKAACNTVLCKAAVLTTGSTDTSAFERRFSQNTAHDG